MGIYLSTRTTLKIIRDKGMGSFVPGDESSITNHTRLKAPKVAEVIEFATDEGLLNEPKEQGENYMLNTKGKRYLKGYWFFPTGVINKYANDHGWVVSLFGGVLGTLLVLLLQKILTALL